MDFEEEEIISEKQFRKYYRPLLFISIIIGIVTLITQLFLETMGDVTPFNYIAEAITILLFIYLTIFTIIFFLIILGAPFYWIYRFFFWLAKNRLYRKRFSEFQQDKVSYDILKDKVKEILAFYPKYCVKNRTKIRIAHLYSYVGLRFKIGMNYRMRDEILLCNRKNKSPNQLNIPDDEWYLFQHSDCREKPFSGYPNHSFDKLYFKYLFKPLLDNGWNEIVLESDYFNLKLIKYCLYNDDYLIIYDITELKHESEVEL